MNDSAFLETIMDPASAPLATTVRHVLCDILGLAETPAALRDDTNLFDLGMDSLAVVHFVAAIEQALGVRLRQEDLDGELFEGLGLLIARLEERVACSRG